MIDVPGTVSQILWHFTGGPRWNEGQNRQNVRRKSTAAAYDALLGILGDQELRLGGYKEVVKVRLSSVRVRDAEAKTWRVEHNVDRIMKSAPVCCLADIPIIHLDYHARRYGQFAIGFHREAALRNGFNPVFYTLHDSDVIRNIRQGFGKIKSLDLEVIGDLLDDIRSEVKEADAEINIKGYLSGVRIIVDDAESRIAVAKQSVAKFLAFIKTFDVGEFQSVYCEREWRSVSSFPFQYDDVAMIVMPKSVRGASYFEPFVRTKRKQLGLPEEVPVVPWETLLES